MSAEGESARSFDTVKDQFRPVTVEATVCLDGGLAAEMARLEGDLVRAQENDELHNVESKAPAVAAMIVEIGDRLREAEQTFTFQAIGRRAWAELLDKHPPTEEDVEEGRDFGGGFPVAAIAASCVGPPLSEDDAEWLAEHLSLGQFYRLQAAAIAANVGVGGLGKSPSDTARRLVSGTSSTSAASEEFL